MHSPSSVIITSMAAASGSSTHPMRSACSPKVNQVKLWTERKPCVCSVNENAKIDNASATICPTIASVAAALRRELARLRMINEAASGTAGINQRLATIPRIILKLVELIDVGCSIVAVNSDDQCESDGRFRGGDRDGKN